MSRVACRRASGPIAKVMTATPLRSSRVICICLVAAGPAAAVAVRVRAAAQVVVARWLHTQVWPTRRCPTSTTISRFSDCIARRLQAPCNVGMAPSVKLRTFAIGSRDVASSSVPGAIAYRHADVITVTRLTKLSKANSSPRQRETRAPSPRSHRHHSRPARAQRAARFDSGSRSQPSLPSAE